MISYSVRELEYLECTLNQIRCFIYRWIPRFTPSIGPKGHRQTTSGKSVILVLFLTITFNRLLCWQSQLHCPSRPHGVTVVSLEEASAEGGRGAGREAGRCPKQSGPGSRQEAPESRGHSGQELQGPRQRWQPFWGGPASRCQGKASTATPLYTCKDQSHWHWSFHI